MENLKPRETRIRETTVERLMRWGNYCLVAALVAMAVRGLLLAGSGESKAAKAAYYLAVALGLLVPPLDGIRLTVIRLRKLRELSGQVKLLAAELEELKRTTSQEKQAEQAKGG